MTTATKLTVSRSKFEKVVRDDPDADTSYLEQEDFEEHLAAYKRGAFTYVGLWAQIQVVVPVNTVPPSGVVQTIRSGGLWGIEYDGGSLDEVFEEEADQLEQILTKLGFEVLP